MFPIDHIGIAVIDLEKSIRMYVEDFNFSIKTRESLPDHQVEVAFINTQNTMIELLMPTSANSKLHKFIKDRGPGLHHICYKVDDIVTELSRLASMGYKLVDASPRAGAHNSKVAFLHPSSTGGVLIELCQY